MICVLVWSGVRLVGGPKKKEGRLEVSVDGEWRGVADGISDETAKVVCRKLGYK